MTCRRLKFRLCIWGCVLLSCGLAIGATGSSTANILVALSDTDAAPIPPDPALENLLRGVENKYNRVKTLRLHFQQIYSQDQQVLREEAGTLFLRKPGQMRWEYENPEHKLFLTDGHHVTLYIPEEKRVTETTVSSSDDLRSPMRFLLGGLKFRKEFEKIERVPGPPLDSGDIAFNAVPKQMKDRLEAVMLEVSPQFQIRRMILKEPGGIQTEFRFDSEASDIPLSPELFHFQPPEGTEVIRQ